MRRPGAFEGTALPSHWPTFVKWAVIRSMKHECTRRIIVPLRADDMRRELTLYFQWYNQHRPHQGLDGRIPMDVYLGIREEPLEFETRGNQPIKLRLVVTYLEGRRHLPVVQLETAA